MNSVSLDEWKEEFFKSVDKKQVPAFMGGELTDPDGNPKCESLVNATFNHYKCNCENM